MYRYQHRATQRTGNSELKKHHGALKCAKKIGENESRISIRKHIIKNSLIPSYIGFTSLLLLLTDLVLFEINGSKESFDKLSFTYCCALLSISSNINIMNTGLILISHAIKSCTNVSTQRWYAWVKVMASSISNNKTQKMSMKKLHVNILSGA